MKAAVIRHILSEDTLAANSAVQPGFVTYIRKRNMMDTEIFKHGGGRVTVCGIQCELA